MTGLQVTGAKAMRAALKAAGDDLSDLKDTYGSVAAMVAAEASSRAPRRSGRLAGSIKPNRAAGKAVVNLGGAKIPYTGPIHWGWPARNIAPNPFASEAAVATEDRWVELFRVGVQATLDKVANATP
jgi:hypothetical protein